MTENKQFRLVNEFGDYHIKDGDEELCYDLCSPSMAKENWNNVVNRLNELNEENSKLHIQNDFLKDENQHMKSVLRENREHKRNRIKLTEILRKHHNYAYEQCQKNLDNPVVHRAYEIIRYDVRAIAEEMGIDLND